MYFSCIGEQTVSCYPTRSLTVSDFCSNVQTLTVMYCPMDGPTCPMYSGIGWTVGYGGPQMGQWTPMDGPTCPFQHIFLSPLLQSEETLHTELWSVLPKHRRRSATSAESSRNGDDESEKQEGGEYFPATRLFEYQWPLGDASAEHYMLQEQVAEYLDIRGIQRKYPGMSECGMCVCVGGVRAYVHMHVRKHVTTWECVCVWPPTTHTHSQVVTCCMTCMWAGGG